MVMRAGELSQGARAPGKKRRQPRQLVRELLAQHLERASALEATLEFVSERSNHGNLSLGGDETNRLGEEAIIVGANGEGLQRGEWCHEKRGRCIIRAACFTGGLFTGGLPLPLTRSLPELRRRGLLART